MKKLDQKRISQILGSEMEPLQGHGMPQYMEKNKGENPSSAEIAPSADAARSSDVIPHTHMASECGASPGPQTHEEDVDETIKLWMKRTEEAELGWMKLRIENHKLRKVLRLCLAILTHKNISLLVGQGVQDRVAAEVKAGLEETK